MLLKIFKGLLVVLLLLLVKESGSNSLVLSLSMSLKESLALSMAMKVPGVSKFYPVKDREEGFCRLKLAGTLVVVNLICMMQIIAIYL